MPITFDNPLKAYLSNKKYTIQMQTQNVKAYFIMKKQLPIISDLACNKILKVKYSTSTHTQISNLCYILYVYLKKSHTKIDIFTCIDIVLLHNLQKYLKFLQVPR